MRLAAGLGDTIWKDRHVIWRLQKATLTLQKPSVDTWKPLVPCPVVPNKQDSRPTGAQAVVQNVWQQWKNYSSSNQKGQPWSQRICHFLLTSLQSACASLTSRQLWLIAHPMLRTIRRGLECHALVESDNNLYPLWGATGVKNVLSDWPLG